MNRKIKKTKEALYEVESIIDKKIERNQVYYLIKWKGWGHVDNTWEPSNNLEKNCEELIDAYESNLRKTRSKIFKTILDGSESLLQVKDSEESKFKRLRRFQCSDEDEENDDPQEKKYQKKKRETKHECSARLRNCCLREEAGRARGQVGGRGLNDLSTEIVL